MTNEKKPRGRKAKAAAEIAALQQAGAQPVVVVQQRRRIWPWLMLTFVVLLGGCVAILGSIGNEIESQTGVADPADYDLAITGCAVDGLLSWPKVTGEITNTSAERQGFEINIEVVLDGRRVGQQPHYEDSIAAGQTAAFDIAIIDATDLAANAPIECNATVNYSFFDE